MSVPSKLYSTGKGFFTLLIVTRMRTRGLQDKPHELFLSDEGTDHPVGITFLTASSSRSNL